MACKSSKHKCSDAQPGRETREVSDPHGFSALIQRSPPPEAAQQLKPASPPRRCVSGARILLAEDNCINQEVAVELLRIAGITVDVASDGVAAVARAGGERYDLVLMDVQMPGIDGLEATRRIRAMPMHAVTPIVAMTASAFGDDRAACLAAGMNDHIGKPVDPDQLYRVLARWLSPTAEPQTRETTVIGREAARAAFPPVPASRSLTSIPGLTPARALTYLPGHEAIYRRVLSLFAAHHAGAFPPLLALAQQGDWPGLRQALHTLRGSLSAIGAVELCAQALALERMLDGEADPAEQFARTEVFDADLRTLAHQIDSVLSSTTLRNDKPGFALGESCADEKNYPPS